MPDHNKCPSSEKEHEKCIFRLSYFHRVQPNYTYPKVTYSGPRVTFSDPKLTHSDSIHTSPYLHLPHLLLVPLLAIICVKSNLWVVVGGGLVASNFNVM